MTVLVCIPYWNAAPYIERAVRSVLSQTERDLVCVVIGDGNTPPLPAISDDRLIVHTYPTNRGAYFAQDVAIWASPFDRYAVVAADDWVDPDHLERLLAQGGDRCAGSVWAHGDGAAYCGPRNKGHATCRGIHSGRHPYEVGLYRTERYREIGAHNPGERIGQDSLTLKIMRLIEPVPPSEATTYNRLFRPGSLCTDPATKAGSPARTAMRARNRAIVMECERIANHPFARRDRGVRAARIREYRDSLVPTALKVALEAEVDELRGRLA